MLTEREKMRLAYRLGYNIGYMRGMFRGMENIWRSLIYLAGKLKKGENPSAEEVIERGFER